ncbi:hypothetical protein [Brevibacterium luteolum]|uniref:hypothetical protein n=1 Tax=Brevibacterium luteolum TaxID=199591 RepID=UPI00223BE4C2|nr:hypothetical protein [Brevibacterium luteolum]MCT1874245.1 hypothetical protein [Brevibacterium luteolum]MCT1893456.1 hypothetical protein [Brevibacterium luteolum]
MNPADPHLGHHRLGPDDRHPPPAPSAIGTIGAVCAPFHHRLEGAARIAWGFISLIGGVCCVPTAMYAGTFLFGP